LKFSFRAVVSSLLLIARYTVAAHLRQSKVENLGVAAIRHENVCRLDVAVNHGFGVGGVQAPERKSIGARIRIVSIPACAYGSNGLGQPSLCSLLTVSTGQAAPHTTSYAVAQGRCEAAPTCLD
jgi:hypothetical protein